MREKVIADYDAHFAENRNRAFEELMERRKPGCQAEIPRLWQGYSLWTKRHEKS